MTDYSERLGIQNKCFELFFYCLENDIYYSSKSELMDLAVILLEYMQNTKKDFMDFAESINFLQ